MVNAIPEGYGSVTPYLVAKDCAAALKWYSEYLGAVELMRLTMPSGSIGHCEFRIGNSNVMMGEETPEMDALSPESVGGSPVSICLYVEDVDTVFKAAIDGGATETRPLQDQFYGDRSGSLKDPFGHLWTIATHIEDVSNEEVQQRMDQFFK